MTEYFHILSWSKIFSLILQRHFLNLEQEKGNRDAYRRKHYFFLSSLAQSSEFNELPVYYLWSLFLGRLYSLMKSIAFVGDERRRKRRQLEELK